MAVAATPAQIWPFLVQIGWGRAGWYGYDWVDNGGRPSTWEILPDWQGLEVGNLEPVDETHTRLITRMRDHYRWTSPYLAVQLAVDAFDFPFMRKVLLGIKARAEAWAVQQGRE